MVSNTTAAAAHICVPPMKVTSNGIFQGDNPLDSALPLLILQVVLVVTLTRCLAFLLKPLRQPRVIAEIIGGILLGPSALGRNKTYINTIFPSKSLLVLDTVANIGLLLFLFLVGLELDPKSIRKTGKKALAIAIAGISLPFALGIGTSYILRATISKGVDSIAFLVFMGVALSITAFPVLARILAELKLLTTNIGRLAMSAAAVNDVAAWILLALAIALSGSGQSPLVAVWALFSGCGFIICSILLISPILKWMAKQCPEGEPVKEIYVCATLVIVLAAGFVTDAIGIHAMFGAFVVGILVPKDGPFRSVLVEKVEDLVSGIFLPLYFVSSGLKTNIATIQGVRSWGLLGLVIVTACFGKIVGSTAVSLLCKIPFREALTLGFLMNSKGLVEVIVLNIGRDRKVLNDQTFAIMVLMALFTTFITTPLVVFFYKPGKRGSLLAGYKHRKIERKNRTDPELRILTCFHGARNIPSLINLLEASRGTDKRKGLCVYAMHLMELSERPSAILMVHKARKNGRPFWNKSQGSASDRMTVAFESYEQLSHVSIRPMTAISSMSDIHEDINTTAERKRVAIIILPFHKHQKMDGSLEITQSSFRMVNQKVLENAPCSVGILVDRGLGGTTHISAGNVSYFVVALFFGGRDDREALAYAARMAEHSGIKLMAIRFLLDLDNIVEEIAGDEEFLLEFKQDVAKKNPLIYEEKVVRHVKDITSAVSEVSNCNLFLVGRVSNGVTNLLSSVRSDCPELGPVGNLLTLPEYSVTASVLVVQQYFSGGISQVSTSSVEQSLGDGISDSA